MDFLGRKRSAPDHLIVAMVKYLSGPQCGVERKHGPQFGNHLFMCSISAARVHQVRKNAMGWYSYCRRKDTQLTLNRPLRTFLPV